MVAFLLQQGFQVYLVDFGEPDQADAYVTLNDYVLDWLPGSVRPAENAPRPTGANRNFSTGLFDVAGSAISPAG